MKIIPALRDIEPDVLYGHFAFGLEINLAGTPAMDKLWEYISNGKKNSESGKSKYQLVGNLSSSLILNDTDNWFFVNTCIPVIEEYKKVFQKSQSKPGQQNIFQNNIPYVMNSLWVNFQKQHEFNPLHHHAGLYSFVIFMKIPYDWRKQHEIPFVKESNAPKASNFEFVYIDIMGKINTYEYKLDPSCEGIMLFFPAEMNHMVYPFYECEEERITISGNIVYDI